MFRERSTWSRYGGHYDKPRAKASKDIPIRRNFAASSLENEENGHRLVESKSKAAFRLVYRMLRHIRETVMVWLIKENTDECSNHPYPSFLFIFYSLSLFLFLFFIFFYFFYFSLSSPFSQTSRSRPVFRRRLRSSTVQNEGTLLGKVFSIERNAHPSPSPSPRIKTQDKLDLPPPSPTLLFCPHYDRE